jgi:hypothetical protein
MADMEDRPVHPIAVNRRIPRPSTDQTRRRMGDVSDAAADRDDAPHGTSLLPRDLTTDQLAAAPVLASIDTLVIEGLSEDEDDAFAAALGS